MWWCNDDDDHDDSNKDNELNELFDKNQINIDTERIYASKSAWKTHNEVRALLSEISDYLSCLSAKPNNPFIKCENASILSAVNFTPVVCVEIISWWANETLGCKCSNQWLPIWQAQI